MSVKSLFENEIIDNHGILHLTRKKLRNDRWKWNEMEV